MNFDFSEDQLAIRDAVARGGWFGVTMPKEHGGAGLGISAAAMVARVKISPVARGLVLQK